MWTRRDFDDGHKSSKAGSGGIPQCLSGHEPPWQSSLPEPGGRRHSSVSDSGDTGIGTLCSDSLDDDSSSSTTPLSFLPFTPNCTSLNGKVIPVVQVIPSQASLGMPPSPIHTGHMSRTCQLSFSVMSPRGAPSIVDMRDGPPLRRWSSLTRLSSGPENSSAGTSGCRNDSAAHGSLDRGRRHGSKKHPLVSSEDLCLPLSSCNKTLLRSPDASPVYRYIDDSRSTGLETDLYLFSTVFSLDKHNSSHVNCSSLLEAALPQGGGSSLAHQPDSRPSTHSTLRTQKWLTEQMGYSPKAGRGKEHSERCGCGTEDFNGNKFSPWQHGPQQESSVNQISLPVNILVKVKEGLLRQKEVEIERQKQQILQLHSRIRENELRAQQVMQSHKSLYDESVDMQESTVRTPSKAVLPRTHLTETLGRKLAVAELEVLHLNEIFKEITQKYAEDIRKLEEKLRTRDRYISSLKKRCQRESDQNQEKQQRIETLEKYLSDLPTLDELHVHAKQGEAVQQRAQDLENTLSWLQRSLQDECALMKEKELTVSLQAQREEELIASVFSLQQKVRQCLDDGVRIPMQDLKRLEVEHSDLLKQQDHSSRLFNHQKEQIERLTSQLTVTSTRLHQERGRQAELREQHTAAPPKGLLQAWQGAAEATPPVQMPQVAQLLREMSLCLLDLQALCSILGQRAQGHEPNLSLLLGMKSFNVSTEESDCKLMVEEELRFKLLEVGQLRRDIDELMRSISDAPLSVWMTAVSLSDTHQPVV